MQQWIFKLVLCLIIFAASGSAFPQIPTMNAVINTPTPTLTPEGVTVDTFLFGWDDVPGKDSARLTGYLKNRFSLDWVESATIEKMDGDGVINLTSGNHYLSLELIEYKTKLSLKIDDGRKAEFSGIMVDGKLNIYTGMVSYTRIMGWKFAENDIKLDAGSWLQWRNMDDEPFFTLNEVNGKLPNITVRSRTYFYFNTTGSFKFNLYYPMMREAPLPQTITVKLNPSGSLPPLPNTYSGTAKFTNSSGEFDVPAGTLIEAMIDNVTKGIAKVMINGRYIIDVKGTNSDSGKLIQFRIANMTAAQKIYFNTDYPPPGYLDITVSDGSPISICGYDRLKCENIGAPVKFDGSASYDPDGSISSYNWEFGDGTAATGMQTKHVFNNYRWNGSAYQPFIVNLTVIDNSGKAGKASQKVVIWIAGDANGDGIVNILDASILGMKWNSNDPCADLNNDDRVNIIDAAIIGLKWGNRA